MRHTRNGFSLMEVILVMVILVAIAAVAVPVVSSMLTANNLDAAKDTVDAGLKKARNKAREEGRAYKFAVKANTGAYRIAPDSDEFWGGGKASDGQVIEGKLPEKVCFSQPQGVGSSGGSGDWSTVATFLADGTALDDGQVGIAFEGSSSPVTISVKAATGSISAEKGAAGASH